MARVLVVDDLAVDRRVIGEFLRKDADLDVDFAANGVEALTRMEEARPFDLIVTDLVMPEMDGLELVKAIRRDYPVVPVVLVTARGNEEIAVHALEQGASSYVPKRNLAGDLLDTVRTVLTLSRSKRGETELMCCLTKNERAFLLDNDSSLINPLATHLQQETARMGLCDEAEQTRVAVALEEALVNALYHGNLGLTSELREHDRSEYDTLVARRREQTPYQDRRIHVEARLSRDEAVFVVQDEGLGFDPSSLPDPTDPASLERACGRGVLIMRTLMDEVTYNGDGNAVTLVKRCESNRKPVGSQSR
ncbi:MAG: ATP-binding protein [Planctomycetota bacterium]|jgi:CheY-like chemotaxis protein/anti-sigma regulatory factor (Ser/Thr protein kinase)